MTPDARAARAAITIAALPASEAGACAVDRRTFLQDSVAVVALGAPGSWAAWREAIARSHEQRRPLLTEETFNAHVQSIRSQGATAERDFVTAVRSDVRALLRGRFALTAVQERNIAAFSTADIATIVSAVDRGFLPRNAFRLRLVSSRVAVRPGMDRKASAECDVTAERSATQLPDGAIAEVWTVVIAP